MSDPSIDLPEMDLPEMGPPSPELDALVSLLRSATPGPATLGAARAGVMAGLAGLTAGSAAAASAAAGSAQVASTVAGSTTAAAGSTAAGSTAAGISAPSAIASSSTGAEGAAPLSGAPLSGTPLSATYASLLKLGLLAVIVTLLGGPAAGPFGWPKHLPSIHAPVAIESRSAEETREPDANEERSTGLASTELASTEPASRETVAPSITPIADGAAPPPLDGARDDATDSAKGGRIARPVPDLPLQIVITQTPSAETSAPSEAMASAMRLYARERYPEASVLFQRVLEGQTEDGADRVSEAEFFLAKCLYHLGLYHASATAFDEVTRRGEQHPYFEPSLTWLAMLAEQLPDPSGVIESVGRYRPAQLARLDVDGSREHYHRLLYLLGRSRYQTRRFGEAIRLFRQVPEDSPVALEARFFEGISHVRLRRARPAHAAFRRVIDAVRTGHTGGHEDPDRMRDLAWMSVARLYYSMAMQLPPRENEQASELLSLAVAAWRRIPLSSEHWLDSFFEETWALYVAREHSRALGHVHALESPHFRDRANPEAQVVRAMIQFEHCQWDQVDHSLRAFHARFDPLLVAAERAERMADSHENAFRMLVAVRAGSSRVPPPIRPALRAAFADRELLRQLDDVRAIDGEIALLAGMDRELLDSSLATRVSADLAVLRSFTLDRAGELATARIHRLAEDLRERMNQMDTVELELATQRREELERPNPSPMGPAEGGHIWAVEGDQIWPWDGEWWRDELPFYHQEIESRCAR
jgi:TolA-binding protein